MKLIFKQRMFSWLDSYDVYDDRGDKIYRVEGQLGLTHAVKIFNRNKQEVGSVHEKLISLTPQFEIHQNGKHIGSIRRKMISMFGPKYDIDFKGWNVDGNILEWDYKIKDNHKNLIATVSKEHLRLTDTYALNIINPDDALFVLMFVIAIDAEKCSRGDD